MPPDGAQGSGSHCCSCVRMSVYLAASMAVLILAALAFCISLVSTNWSASGQELKMGVWDFCIHPKQNDTWSCYPSNAGKYISPSNNKFRPLENNLEYECHFVLECLMPRSNIHWRRICENFIYALSSRKSR